MGCICGGVCGRGEVFASMSVTIAPPRDALECKLASLLIHAVYMFWSVQVRYLHGVQHAWQIAGGLCDVCLLNASPQQRARDRRTPAAALVRDRHELCAVSRFRMLCTSSSVIAHALHEPGDEVALLAGHGQLL
jgi:hypothetical protein